MMDPWPTRRRWLALSAVGLTLIVPNSCRQAADVEERALCATPNEPSVGCRACRLDHCCESVLACRGDPHCDELDACLVPCAGEATCRAKCRDDHPLGRRDPREALARLSACSAAMCPEACPGDPLLLPAPECAECATTDCGAELDACATNEHCVALTYCEQPCASHDHRCRGDCRRRHPEGATLARTLTECIARTCRAPCDYAEAADWSCADDTPVVGSGPPLELTYEIQQFADEVEPAVRATAKVCDVADDDCTAPLDSDVADRDGNVTVTVPHGFDGYLLHERAGLMPLLVFVDWPILVGGGKPEPTVPTPETFKKFVDTFGLGPVDPDRGHVYIRPNHCGPTPASLEGISFVIEPIDPMMIPYYGGVFGTGHESFTSSEGEGGFVNLASGSYVVTVVLRATGACVARRQVIVRPGAVTAVRSYPAACL